MADKSFVAVSPRLQDATGRDTGRAWYVTCGHRHAEECAGKFDQRITRTTTTTFLSTATPSSSVARRRTFRNLALSVLIASGSIQPEARRFATVPLILRNDTIYLLVKDRMSFVWSQSPSLGSGSNKKP